MGSDYLRISHYFDMHKTSFYQEIRHIKLKFLRVFNSERN